MRLRNLVQTGMSAAALMVFVAGCGGAKSPAVTEAKTTAATTVAAKTGGHDHDHDHDHAEHTHGEWWCSPHAVPEDECGQCNPKLAAEMKKKGDWCAKHDRPDSQCFICHPEKAEAFAAKYEAHYGKPLPKKGEKKGS